MFNLGGGEGGQRADRARRAVFKPKTLTLILMCDKASGGGGGEISITIQDVEIF